MTAKEFVANINREEFASFYYTHSNKDVCLEYKTSKATLTKIIALFGIVPKTPEQSNELIRQTLINKSEEEKTQIEKKRQDTCLEKYGSTNPMQNEEIKNKVSNILQGFSDEQYAKRTEKFRKTMESKSQEEKDTIAMHRACATKKYFASMSDEERASFSQRMSETYAKLPEEVKEKRKQKISETYKKNCLNKYGVTNTSKLKEIQNKWSQTCMEKYGVPFACMRGECRNYSKTDSGPNKAFAEKLTSLGIEFTKEFPLDKYSFDFRVNNYLIEIDPSATHNVIWSPFDNPISKDYHKLKTQCAEKHGYHCVHIFDWDNVEKIIQLFLQKREMALARSCEVVYLDKETSSAYINKYHLQGDARDEIRMGLVEKKSKELISVMTFGKPRYNKKYDWELIRYCAHKSVVGGASKLFSHFITNHPGESVISYCDLSKFNGEVYDFLGFKKINSSISAHWYNPKTRIHITDNLLRQRGFDQLLGEEYGCFGKGTSNEELMVQHGFVKIYDAGQATYIFSNEG